ncbi:MAG: ribosomal protein L4Pstart only [archaeon GW2011_AR13]|nr:MAG: ribosomal protein L4Pstart only [archaeon GW2011_AR13]
MKSNILDIEGKKKGTIDLPVCFNQTVREDLIAKVLESKKIKQPYSPSPVAGQQASASGIINCSKYTRRSKSSSSKSCFNDKHFKNK